MLIEVVSFCVEWRLHAAGSSPGWSSPSFMPASSRSLCWLVVLLVLAWGVGMDTRDVDRPCRRSCSDPCRVVSSWSFGRPVGGCGTMGVGRPFSIGLLPHPMPGPASHSRLSCVAFACHALMTKFQCPEALFRHCSNVVPVGHMISCSWP